ncbi:MAG: aminopeptidase [Solirubrobacteraceae bacterium]
MDAEQRLAELALGLGANLQPGQDLYVAAEVGHLNTVRVLAERAYRAGARYVDIRLFDPLVQRSRLAHVPDLALGHVPSWELERRRRMGEGGAASIKLTGPTAPHALDQIEPARVARASVPSMLGGLELEALVNYTIVPCPTAGWAAALRPELAANDGLAALWRDIAYVCRLDEPDPAAAWHARLGELADRAQRLTSLRLDSVRFQDPGTDLRVGLLPGALWVGPGQMVTASGIAHVDNLPTEEVFTVPDPVRAQGHVRLTRPALIGGRLIDDVELELAGGEVVRLSAGDGVPALEQFVASDPGACRLGELALVSSEGRVGSLDRTFGVTLLDENAASHIALGFGFPECVEPDDRAAVNDSVHHLDVMIGSGEIEVTGTDRSGRDHPLLRAGDWALSD